MADHFPSPVSSTILRKVAISARFGSLTLAFVIGLILLPETRNVFPEG
jgi:hypothetical protein